MNPEYNHIKKTLSKNAPGLASCLVMLSLLACRFFSLLEPPPTLIPTPVPGVNELRFTNAETGRRFRSLNEYINGFIDGTWQTSSYHLSGNFYESSWCRGAGVAPDCEYRYSTSDNRDQHVIDLYTLFYNDFPEVTGLGFSARQVPVETGWGAAFSFSEGGTTTISEGWGVTFSEYTAPTGPPLATVMLGGGYSYQINDTYILYPAGLPIRDDLALYLSGPEAMRDRGLTQIQALAQKVAAEIIAHKVPTCDPQPYQGNGIPPECITRAMTPAEEAAELTKADAYFSEQDQILRDHYQEMYTAWMTAFPLDQFWP